MTDAAAYPLAEVSTADLFEELNRRADLGAFLILVGNAEAAALFGRLDPDFTPCFIGQRLRNPDAKDRVARCTAAAVSHYLKAIQ